MDAFFALHKKQPSLMRFTQPVWTSLKHRMFSQVLGDLANRLGITRDRTT